MSCISVIPNGAGRDACILDQPTSLFFFNTDFKFSNYQDAENLDKWRVAIQESLAVYPTADMQNVTTTKPSETKETDGAGVEITTRLSPGSAIVNLKTSSCDFKEILNSMQGGVYGIAIGLGANKVMLLENSKGELKGFKGQCTAIPFGIPGKDAKLEEFQVAINWQNVNEWSNYRIIELPIMLNELTELTPLGLDVQIKTPLSATTMAVKITQRCMGIGETEALTWVTTATNVADANVTPVAGADGEYALAVTKDTTPVALVAGDYIKGYFVKMDTLIYEKISAEIICRI